MNGAPKPPKQKHVIPEVSDRDRVEAVRIDDAEWHEGILLDAVNIWTDAFQNLQDERSRQLLVPRVHYAEYLDAKWAKGNSDLLELMLTRSAHAEKRIRELDACADAFNALIPDITGNDYERKAAAIARAVDIIGDAYTRITGKAPRFKRAVISMPPRRRAA